MSVRLNSKLIDAAPNVARLPTAAPRQVKQEMNKAARAERVRFRKENPWPGEHEYGPMRAQRIEAERLAAIMLGINQTPAMLIVCAMLGTMDDGQRQKIVEQLAGGAAGGRQAHIEAITLVQTAKMTFGEQLDLLKAIERLTGKEGR